MTLRQITTARKDRDPIQITGDVVSKNFAITPAYHRDGDTYDDAYFAGHFTLTHIPSGYTLLPDSYVSDLTVDELREVARIAEAQPIDWANFADTPTDTSVFVRAVLEFRANRPAPETVIHV